MAMRPAQHPQHQLESTHARFKAFLWADGEDQRTQETANKLADGLRKPDIDVTVDSLQPGTVDLLFHPFKVGCGTPDKGTLDKLADEIRSGSQKWWDTTYRTSANPLSKVLDCFIQKDCTPLDSGTDTVDTCTVWSSACSSPIEWKGRFSYASSATEAFLLEYANGMDAGWGRVGPPPNLQVMLQMHELYFEETERKPTTDKNEPYVAKIQGSNLIKELSNVINRAAGKPSGCPHATINSQFVGLVGHDTNLASVGALLILGWLFNDPKLPSDTKFIPPNDALPAGALVFELRLRNGQYFVRVEYVTQSLSQMRNKEGGAYRLAVRGPDCGPSPALCEMPLATFNKRVDAIGTELLSRCDGGKQTCSKPAMGSPRRRNNR
jgi:hypothetical protein